MSSYIEIDCSKPYVEQVSLICRCCLSSGKHMKDAYRLADYFKELAGISISESDGLPRWICLPCSMYLMKAVRFKLKMQKAHVLLYSYSSRCAPFPIDGQDPELIKYASPALSVTTTLNFDSLSTTKDGFYDHLEHQKIYNITELNTDVAKKEMLPVQSEKQEFFDTIDHNLTEEKLDFKEEQSGFSDYEDNIPLHEYKTNIDMNAEDIVNLLERSECLLTEEIPSNVKKKKRDRAKKDKRKKEKENSGGKRKKRKRDSIEEDVDVKQETQNERKRITEYYMDPNKIKVIDLDPDEQMRQLELESKSDGFLKFPYKCHLCYKGFNFETKLSNHMQKHSPSRGKFECRLCRMRLPTRYSHKVHMLIHTRRYECLECGRRMIDRTSIVEHYRTQHEGYTNCYTCHLCGKQSNNNKTHRGHMRNSHGAERPQCDVCKKTFVNKDSLADHLLIHEGIKNYECNICEKRFRTKNQLKHHFVSHSDAKDYYCVECDVRFKSASNLYIHLRKSVKHIDKRLLKYKCTNCPKSFTTETQLSRHTRVQHLGERPHPCHECGASLASTNSLQKHLRRHRGRTCVAVHTCHTCGRSFNGLSVLQNHMRVHSGDKPFRCARCGRGFAQRAAMVTHVKLVHLKLKRTAKVSADVILADGSGDKAESWRPATAFYTDPTPP